MPATHQSQVERAISHLNESAYGTDRASGDTYRRIVSDSVQIAQLSTNFTDDAGYDNGSDIASDRWATTADAQAAFSPDFCFQDAGYFLKDALGGYAVSGSAAPYTHTFTPQDMNTSRQMPSRTYLEKLGGIFIRKVSSIVLTQLTISGGKMGRLKIAAQYTGSGKYAVNPGGYSLPSLSSGLEYAYGSQAFFRFYDNDDGTNQVETAVAAGTASADGNITVTVTAAGMAGSPISVVVPIANLDVPSAWAEKVRIALKNHLVISNFFQIGGTTTNIVLTARVRAANDATMNIAIADTDTTGITPVATSTDTTAGVAGDYQSYTCDLETWSLTFNNPPADDGYRQCSEYVVAGDPRSGQTRSEFLVGARSIRFEFMARMQSTDKMRDWMQAGKDLTLEIPIVGIDDNNSSLRLRHTKVLVDSAQEVTGAGGDFIGIQGGAELMSNSGVIPFTATLLNDVSSYAA